VSWLRPLGDTGLEVSALGLGTVKLGRTEGLRHLEPFSLPDEKSAARLLDRARELGVNLLDTAPAYGTSEERLGRLLRDRRGDWILCTKVGEEFEDGRSRFDFSAAHTRRSVERSLRRLATDVLDIVLVHSDGDDLARLEGGALATLRDMQGEGLVRAVGVSTKTRSGGLATAAACDVVMPTYSLASREEEPVLDACAAGTCAALVKKALSSGHLGEDPAGFLHDSLGLALGHPGTTAVVVGTLSPAHLEQNVAIARGIVG